MITYNVYTYELSMLCKVVLYILASVLNASYVYLIILELRTLLFESGSTVPRSERYTYNVHV